MIDAETPEAGRLLQLLAGTITAQGGHLHPGIRIVERAGDMHVACDPGRGPAGLPLAEVPRHLLVPIGGITWADSRTRLEPADVEPGLTSLQRDVLDLLVSLLNATGKLAWYQANHPRGALANDSPVVPAIRRLRPAFVPAPGAEGYLRTRQFRATSADGTGDPAQATAVLMPLLDLVNHHPASPGFGLDEHGMRIAVSQPLGTEACFVRYGNHRDTLDLALHYGYADPGVRFALSAPLCVDVPGLGEVEVGRSRPQGPDARAYPTVTATATGLRFSHLRFESDAPTGLRTVVGLAVRGLAARRGLPDAIAARLSASACAALVDENLRRLDDLATATDRVGLSAAEMLGRAARLQSDRIRAAAGEPYTATTA